MPKGRPRKPIDDAKKQYIGIKATISESKRWKRAVALFGASRCLEISLDALEKAVIEHIDTLAQRSNPNNDKCD